MVFVKGNIPWNKGKKGLQVAWNKGFSVQSNTGRTHFKKGELSAFAGRKHTVKSKRRMSEARKGKACGKNNYSWKGGKPKCKDCEKQLSNYCYTRCRSCSQKLRMSDPEEVRKVLRRRKMSGLEKRVDGIIKKYELPYKFVGNGEFMIENKNPDFVNTNGEKKAIEVFWKRHKDQFRGGCNKWKNERSELFGKYGWKLIFIEGSGLTERRVLKSLK